MDGSTGMEWRWFYVWFQLIKEQTCWRWSEEEELLKVFTEKIYLRV